MTEYREMEPLGPTLTGERIADDAQLSHEWHRRFAADLGGGRWHVVDVSTFVVDASHAAPWMRQSRPVVELRVAHTLCADVADPFGTQLGTADVESTELRGRAVTTEEGARAACAAFDPATLRVPEFERQS